MYTCDYLTERCFIAPLAAHLEAEGVEFMQFAFRWMNCLLMREISVRNTIRMWDTYLVRVFLPFSPLVHEEPIVHARPKGRKPSLNFICMCARPFLSSGVRSFAIWTFRYCFFCLLMWPSLMNFPIQGIIMFLQSLPTADWTEHDVELLLSEAFLLNSVWHNAQSHFGATGLGGSAILVGR